MSLQIEKFGQYLGVKGQEFVTYEDNEITEKIPFYKVDQIVLGSGNCVSTSALLCASMYGIDVLLVGKTGRPLSVMLPLSTDKRVKTRMKQYEAYHNHKGVTIAKEILKARISSQIDLLEKYGFDSSRLKHYLNSITVEGKKIDKIRWNLTGMEGKSTELYLKQYITLFPKYLQPEKRKKYKAKAPLNNLLNLGYEILKGEVYKAVLNAHLDPYLGYLHSMQFAKPSLVYDFQELFRSLIEDFLVSYHRKLEPESFEVHGERVFLKRDEKLKMILALNRLLEKEDTI